MSFFMPDAAYVCFSCLLFFFFFSSRRRHTRFSRDWSSDVCSSDLDALQHLLGEVRRDGEADPLRATAAAEDRSEERRVGKSVGLGGRRSVKKKKEEEGQRGGD